MRTRIKIGLWLVGGVAFTYLFGSVLAWIALGGELGSNGDAMFVSYAVAALAYGGATYMWKHMPEDDSPASSTQSSPLPEQSGMTMDDVARQNVVGTLGYNYLAHPVSYAPSPPPPPGC